MCGKTMITQMANRTRLLYRYYNKPRLIFLREHAPAFTVSCNFRGLLSAYTIVKTIANQSAHMYVHDQHSHDFNFSVKPGDWGLMPLLSAIFHPSAVNIRIMGYWRRERSAASLQQGAQLLFIHRRDLSLRPLLYYVVCENLCPGLCRKQ